MRIIGTTSNKLQQNFFSGGMHSGEVSLKHTENPLCHLWGKQVKSAIKVTFTHTLKNNRNFYGQIPATLMPVVDRNNYGG